VTVRVLRGHCVDVLRALPPESVHCAVTSVPYWQLRDYGTPPQRWADGWVGEWSQEPEPERYVRHTVEVFREVRRVLRGDGTLRLNLGDTYWNDPGGQSEAGGVLGVGPGGEPDDGPAPAGDRGPPPPSEAQGSNEAPPQTVE
jgi:DNA modification methylase